MIEPPYICIACFKEVKTASELCKHGLCRDCNTPDFHKALLNNIQPCNIGSDKDTRRHFIAMVPKP